jgi:hypothetical protein
MDPDNPNQKPAGQRQEEVHAAWRAALHSARLSGAAAAKPGAASAKLPAAVAWLGYGGLVPFVAFCAGSLLGGAHADLSRAALFSYGAVILSFVGALHWGIALAAPGLATRQRAALFAWSVLPALLAWPSLLLYVKPATLLLVGGFAASHEPTALRSQAFIVRLAFKQSIANYIYAWKELVADMGMRQLPLSAVEGQVDRIIPYYDYEVIYGSYFYNS